MKNMVCNIMTIISTVGCYACESPAITQSLANLKTTTRTECVRKLPDQETRKAIFDYKNKKHYTAFNTGDYSSLNAIRVETLKDSNLRTLSLGLLKNEFEIHTLSAKHPHFDLVSMSSGDLNGIPTLRIDWWNLSEPVGEECKKHLILRGNPISMKIDSKTGYITCVSGDIDDEDYLNPSLTTYKRYTYTLSYQD